MRKYSSYLFVVCILGLYITSSYGQDIQRPTRGSAQEMNHLNTVPKNFKTEFIVADEEGRKKCEFLMELYEILQDDPTVPKILP